MITTRNLSADSLEVAPDVAVALDAVSPAPVLITEQEVAFSTTVAAQARPTTTHWWSDATSVVVSAMHRMVATSASHASPARRHYPKHYAFLENALMSREMDRL